MKFVTLNENEFTEFENTHPLGSFYQTIKWGKLKEKNGWKYYLVGVKEDDKVIAACLLLEKKVFLSLTLFYSPRGFLLDYNNKKLLEFFTKNVKKFAKMHHAIFIKIDPTIIEFEKDINGDAIKGGISNKNIIDSLKSLGYKNVNTHLQPNIVFTLDLKNKTIDEIYNKMENTTKQRVRKNESIGIKTRELSRDELSIFKSIMQNTADRRGFIDRSLSYYENMYDIFDNMKILLSYIDIKEYSNNEKIRLNKTTDEIKKLKESLNKENANTKKINNKLKEAEVLAKSLEKTIKKCEDIMKKENTNIINLGCLMFMFHGREVLSLFGGVYDEYREFMPAYTLNYDMIKYACEKGYDKYNFYGIDEYKDKSNPMYGLYDFKRGFSGVVEEYIGTYDLIISKFWYLMYTFAYNKVYLKIKSSKH
ncbi:putative aminoacyltransferase FemX [Clostridium sp. CAG:1193]|nr:putative aminoacyltransferase FemX [Clostridium sp. CAG:1193]